MSDSDIDVNVHSLIAHLAKHLRWLQVNTTPVGSPLDIRGTMMCGSYGEDRSISLAFPPRIGGDLPPKVDIEMWVCVSRRIALRSDIPIEVKQMLLSVADAVVKFYAVADKFPPKGAS